MSKIVQWKRGNTSVSSAYIGMQGEITVNTDDYSLNLHDGITPGGFKISNDADLDVNIGNLRIYDQTITGTQSNANISIIPLGTGVVDIPNTAHIGSILAGVNKDAYIGEIFNPFVGGNVFTMSSAVAQKPLIVRANSSVLGIYLNTDGSIGLRGPTSNVFPVSITGATSVSGQLYVSNTVISTQSMNAVGFYASPDSGVGYAFSTANLETGLGHYEIGNISILGLNHDDIQVAKFISNGETQLTGNLVVSSTGTEFGSFPTAFVQIYSNVDSYSQVIHQNINNGPLSSADFIPTANNGNDSAHFGDFGIAGENYNYPGYGIIKPNDVYLLAVGNNITGPGSVDSGNLILGSTTGNINFFVGAPEDANVIAQLNTTGFIPGANVTYSLGSQASQWKELWVSNNTIYIGSVPLTVDANGNFTVNGSPVSGSTVLPYLELTNSPFIVQPTEFGEPVTVTAAPQGVNARFDVVIGAGPTIDSVTITQPGTGYVTNQHYRIWSYNIGGPNDASSIEFDVDTVGENGELLTIANVAFFGVASNTPGTYSSVDAEYRGGVYDQISANVTLTRGRRRALYNSELEQEYDDNTYLSPLGTEWNNDGWGDLIDVRSRSYTTFRAALNNQVGNNIIGAELIMKDVVNDRYYKFSFSAWGENNGAYSYTRTEIIDPNFFKKENYGEEVDIFIPDLEPGTGIGITRGNNNGIYNPYREEGWDSDVSPDGTQWNINGWDDLSDIESRTYTNFYNAYDGNLGNSVPGSRAVMYIPDNGKYYAIQWLGWTQGGDGGGFSYYRYELDLTKLNEGVKFADGTVLKSAEGLGRVKSVASGGRRIEEVTGSKTVSVTAVTITNITATASRSVVDDNRFWVSNSATDIAAIINNPSAFGIQDYATIQFSLDNATWYTYSSSYSGTSTEIGVQCFGGPFTYNEGDTVYFRYSSGGSPQVWWDKADLPGGSANFRGAIIDYHAYSGEATWIGTIHIVDDTGNEHITHTEVSSGSSDSENDDLWIVPNEGQVAYRRIDGEAKTLKVQWMAKVFYGTEYYD